MTLVEIKTVIDRLAEKFSPQTPISIFIRNVSNRAEIIDIATIATSIYSKDDQILIFPSMPLEEKSGKLLMEVEEAAEFAGGDLKAYKLKELCRDKNFYPAIRMPGKNGRGRRIFIHKERLIQWIEEQSRKAS